MDSRSIGTLTVSVVGLGCNQFGTASCDEDTSSAIVHEAIDAGITFFDVADEYGQNYADPTDPQGWGRSEEILGRALKGRRDQVVLASKFGARPHADPSSGGNSAKWIRTAVEDSLRRLDTDHIDLYQAHFPDPEVPIEETLGALGDLVKSGKVREIGCCNFTSSMLTESDAVSARLGVAHFASAQNPLNLFQRTALDDLVPTCEKLDLKVIPYYPLASGMLTGKYRRGVPLPDSTRLTDGVMITPEARDRLFSEKTFARLEALERFATDHGHSLLELAFAWLLAQPSVATVIAGASKIGQASTNAAAGQWRLSLEDAARAARAMIDAA